MTSRSMNRALVALLFLLTVSHAWAQSPSPTPATSSKYLRVALAGAAPFVESGNDGPTGFAADLWAGIARSNGWSSEYRAYPSTNEAIQAVVNGEADVLVGNTSITSGRQKEVEFSQPFYRAGFQIMVSEQRHHVSRVLVRLAEPQHLQVLGGIGIFVLIATVVVAAFEGRHNPDFPKTRSAGLAEAFYYVMGLVTGKSAYKGFPGVLGRLVLVGWMIASLFVVSYVTGILASAMTVDSLTGHIAGPQDLGNKLVGLIGGTESEDYAKARNLDYVAYPDIDAAVKGLLASKVQCLVGDAPVLQYYDYSHPRLPIHEVGPIFEPLNYGFTVATNSPLRGAINFALLHLEENGALDALGQKYFGASYQK